MERLHPSDLEEGDSVFYNSRWRRLESSPTNDIDKSTYVLELEGVGTPVYFDYGDEPLWYDKVIEEEPVAAKRSVEELLTEGASEAELLSENLQDYEPETGSLARAVPAE